MSDILFQKTGRAGVVTLNKPETLNAVTDAMLTALNEQLDEWQQDESVERIIIKAVPGRAFSAGGDIRHLYERGKAGDHDFDFFAREYRLNARIAKFPKPYVAIVDGIAMGGGVGVSFHGSHRLAGSNMSFAMPEVGIGFFPDVGASYFLSRLPGALGMYLGLTGSRIQQGDALWSGLATHAFDSGQSAELFSRLCEAEMMEAVLTEFQIQPESRIEAEMPRIDKYFGSDTLTGIIAALKEASNEDEWAKKTLAVLKQKSPLSLGIAHRQISLGKSMDIDDCMRMEYRILRRILAGQDFYEGIRAAIIDKDRKPNWQHRSIDDITPAMVDTYFAPLGKEELALP